MISARLLLVAATMVLTSGCSLVLQWNLNELECTSSGECLDGFTCLGGKCTAPHSRLKNESCNEAIQCAAQLYCTPEFFCQAACTSLIYYESPADCEAYEFCSPLLVSDDPATYEGICKPTDCFTDDDCGGADEICVELGEAGTACNLEDTEEECPDETAAVSVCLRKCTLDWSGVYEDGCNSLAGERKYCQPIGLEGRRRLVCLDTVADSQDVGEQCLAVTNPCRPGLTCQAGTCFQLCDTSIDPPEDACPTDELCCLVSSEAEAYGICAPGPICPAL